MVWNVLEFKGSCQEIIYVLVVSKATTTLAFLNAPAALVALQEYSS